VSANNYTLYRRLGHGAMAEVFLARREDGERVALKRMMPHLLENQAVRRRFEDECALALHLEHPNIVRAFEQAMVGDGLYLVFEYIDGVTLSEIMALPAAKSGAPFLPSALYMVDGLLAALHYAHTLRGAEGSPLALVHRDVSPSNLLLSGDGEVKLIDFGVATGKEHTDLTAPGALIGKLGYLAPEMIRAEPVDARADVFSAGVILFQLITGTHPFGDSPTEIVEQVATGQARSASEAAPWVSAPLAAALASALAGRPADRFASAAALRSALLTAGSDEETHRRGRADVGALVRRLNVSERGEECATVTVTVTRTRTRGM